MPEKYLTTNFVPPDPQPPRVEIIHSDLPPAPISAPMPLSSYRDRSLGFTLVTAPLAGVASLVAVLVAILGFQVPLLSLAALLCALAGFALVWLIALIAYQLISVEGALFFHVAMTWRLLFLESRERRKRYGKR